jgi:hypothetical protein
VPPLGFDAHLVEGFTYTLKRQPSEGKYSIAFRCRPSARENLWQCPNWVSLPRSFCRQSTARHHRHRQRYIIWGPLRWLQTGAATILRRWVAPTCSGWTERSQCKRARSETKVPSLLRRRRSWHPPSFRQQRNKSSLDGLCLGVAPMGSLPILEHRISCHVQVTFGEAEGFRTGEAQCATCLQVK